MLILLTNTLPSFEEVLGGESEDPILSMNLTPPDYAETVQPEVESEPTPATLGARTRVTSTTTQRRGRTQGRERKPEEERNP